MSVSNLRTEFFRSVHFLQFVAINLLFVGTLFIRNLIIHQSNRSSNSEHFIIQPPPIALLQSTSDPEESPEAETVTPTTEPSATPKPAWWVPSAQGGRRDFGAISAILPPGFTNQGGASVFGDVIINPGTIGTPAQLIIGTKFAFGIWPYNEQVNYQKPIEFRILLDAAQVAPGTESSLTFMIYNPVTQVWEAIPSQFHPETYQLVAYVQSFKPVAKNFPDWGGRTFFAVFASAVATPTPQQTPIPQQTSIPSTTTVKRNANLRSGPGVNYAIVGQAKAGQQIVLVARNAAGTWYQLNDGKWIAAFLVNNPPNVPVL
jgi:hypothetical protein